MSIFLPRALYFWPMSIDHYENFPVASILLPAHLRPAVQNIYRFARTADDIADEGNAPPSERLRQLHEYEVALHDIHSSRLSSHYSEPIRRVFEPLALTIRQHRLPLKPFHDLLSAFKQDVHKARYDTDTELFDYCRRSANPVGHLMLHLYNASQPSNIEHADAICTGLQLTNFWQDVAIDWKKDRVYIPQEKLRAHDLNDDFIQVNTDRRSPLPDDNRWRQLMQAQVQQARELLEHGLPLSRTLPGRIGYELKLVVFGGLRILQRLDELNYDIFFQRPTLRKRDWIRLVARASLTRS